VEVDRQIAEFGRWETKEKKRRRKEVIDLCQSAVASLPDLTDP
jgi:hypothetical protein